MGIVVRQTKGGGFEPVYGNPTLTSLDGEVRAPLRALLSPIWTDEERAAFGIYLAEPAKIPDGKRPTGQASFEMKDGRVVEVRYVEDIPEEPQLTAAQKVQAMAEAFGLTLEELQDVIAPAHRQPEVKQ